MNFEESERLAAHGGAPLGQMCAKNLGQEKSVPDNCAQDIWLPYPALSSVLNSKLSWSLTCICLTFSVIYLSSFLKNCQSV